MVCGGIKKKRREWKRRCCLPFSLSKNGAALRKTQRNHEKHVDCPFVHSLLSPFTILHALLASSWKTFSKVVKAITYFVLLRHDSWIMYQLGAYLQERPASEDTAFDWGDWESGGNIRVCRIIYREERNYIPPFYFIQECINVAHCTLHAILPQTITKFHLTTIYLIWSNYIPPFHSSKNICKYFRPLPTLSIHRSNI